MVLCSQQSNMNLQTLVKDFVILIIGILGCVTGTYQSVAEIVEHFSKGGTLKKNSLKNYTYKLILRFCF